MAEHQSTREHYRLRLAPEDVPLLWDIVDVFAQRTVKGGERWPRLERILFDLRLMMEQEERANAE